MPVIAFQIYQAYIRKEEGGYSCREMGLEATNLAADGLTNSLIDQEAGIIFASEEGRRQQVTPAHDTMHAPCLRYILKAAFIT